MYLFLNIKLNRHNNAILTLYDTSGRLISEQKLDSKISIINIDKLQSGVYIFQIKTDDNTSTTVRVIKQ